MLVDLRIAARACVLSAALSALVLAASASAQGSPNGPDLQVNAFTTDGQSQPDVDVDSAGRFVVVWRSQTDDPDWAGYDIFARLYSPRGEALTAPFVVNTHTDSLQSYPAVAMAPGGGFVVVWQSRGSVGNDASDVSIQARRFGADGAPLGGQFQVNTETKDEQRMPAIAMDELGRFVVVWDEDGNGAGGIQGQRYAANGSKRGGQFRVDSLTTTTSNWPDVGMNGDGDFVVTWVSVGSDGDDDSGASIQARRFDEAGVAGGVQFQVNEFTPGGQANPSVALDPSGGFLVVWDSQASAEENWWSIRARRFGAPGEPASAESIVNTYTPGSQTTPWVDEDPASGGFVVGWQSYGSPGSDDSYYSIQARRLGADGGPVAEQFQVNAHTPQTQIRPALSVDPNGNFVVAWTSLSSAGSDHDSTSVQARRFDALFRDSFETGTARWGPVAP